MAVVLVFFHTTVVHGGTASPARLLLSTSAIVIVVELLVRRRRGRLRVWVRCGLRLAEGAAGTIAPTVAIPTLVVDLSSVIGKAASAPAASSTVLEL